MGQTGHSDDSHSPDEWVSVVVCCDLVAAERLARDVEAACSAA
jgi:hypothetical protein